MNNKKELEVKSVHKFTQNASMKFRPSFYQPTLPTNSHEEGVVNKVSSILANFFGRSNIEPKRSASNSVVGQNKTYSKSAIIENTSPNKNKSYIAPGNASSKIEGSDDCEPVKSKKGENKSKMDPVQELEGRRIEDGRILTFLQKISADTFLIGNQNQLDLITISGIYQGIIDTEINWSLNVHKKIKKLSIDNKKCLLALECDEEILIYKYDSKKIKNQPNYINKTKLLGEARFLLFLKDSQFGVFYTQNATVYQIQENNGIRLIFNKKYGVGDKLQLFQIPKPIQTTLNIFFKQKSMTSCTHVLWRLQLQFKNLSNTSGGFKSLLRIYDIPNSLVSKFRIDNFSRDIFIMNFKFQILAAKDGYIIDSANTNIQEDGTCLVYHGDHLLHVSENKLYIYSFKIITNSKPNKIDIKSIDSIEVHKDQRYMFFDCLQMLNGNFVLFFQVKPECNNKLKGEIDYTITVTQKLSIQEKLNQIFSFKSPNQLKYIAENSFERIQEKCDMAFKIGLNRRQVYLELWNKSNKKEIQDYKFLLDTMDYETIKQQIQKKLKKSSMPFNQVFKLEQGCFDMLKIDLFSNSNCNQTSIKNYLISHFLLRKLAFFRDSKIRYMQMTNQAKVFNIDIQQYFQCVKMDLKSFILDFASKICFEDKDKSKQLRLFIRSFKFPLRIIYSSILEDLIVLCKNKLINFLKAVPEILPYVHHDIPQGQEPSLYEGLWSQIRPQQWSQNLHIQQISTIYNKDYVQELTKTVWFKRNQYTLHDLVALSKQRIIEIQQFNQSDGIFYHFIQKIFSISKDKTNASEVQVVDFLQSNYSSLPGHLKDKIFLYRKLYNYFISEKYNNPNLSSFNNFLKLKDYELLKELFKYQKIKKGCLLKDAKAIYASIQNGNQLFNEALLHYFASPLSEISDLKYILNRMNSQKRQFHIQNQGIYEVLVKGMQMKLKLGSQNDIPYDQVMIYIQNIPLSKNNPIIEELSTVQRIGEQSQRFKKMKLNMSFLQIVERFQDVLTAMINYQLKSRGVLQMRDQQQLKSITYTILAQIQTVKQKIYKDRLNNLTYFIYISKLMEEKELISYADMLLKDPFLLEYYSTDQKIIQNLVIYMYRWKLTQSPAFIRCQDYLIELLSLLPEDNFYRIYFQAQIQFSIMLSTPQHPIEFRSIESEAVAGEGCDDQSYQKNQNLITIKQITQIINERSVDFIIALDVQKLYQLVKTMQELSFTQDNYLKFTHLTEIYQAITIRLIQLNSIRHALPFIRKLIQLFGESGEQNYCIVFCYAILNVILGEMADNHKKGMAKIAFYTYLRPLELLDIIQERINTKFSNDQENLFLQVQLERVRGNTCSDKWHRCFDGGNVLLEQGIILKIEQKQDKYLHKFQQLIFQSWSHLNNNRQDFSKNFEYTFVYIMLLNNPYSLAKYISIRKQGMNIRILRSYLSYVFRQQIFNGINVLYFSKRIFTIVYNSLMESIPVQMVISQYKGQNITDDQFEMDLPKKIQETHPFQHKIAKSIEAFSKKLNSLRNKQPEDSDKKKKRIEALLSSEASINEQEVSEYPFNDSDDNYQEEKPTNNFVQVKIKKKSQRVFDANKERKMLFQGRNQNMALFLSSSGHQNFELRRTSPTANMLKSAKSFQQGFKSLHFGKKQRKGSDSINIDANYCLDKIQRSQSINKDFQGNLMASHSQQDLFHSTHPISLRPPDLQDHVITSTKSYSPQNQPQQQQIPQIRSQRQDSQTSPIKLQFKNSLIDMDVNLGESLEWKDNQVGGFQVNVQEIDDEEYTPVGRLRKQLLEEFGDNEAEPMFDMSLLAKEQQKEFGHFQEYLIKLITNIYECEQKPLLFVLSLIKQIHNTYPSVGISPQFLDNYNSLQSYNIKYKYNLPIRDMFPIQGIFIQSKDPKVLFQFAKNTILPFVDFDNILVVAKLIHFALKRSQIKDQLYYSYLQTAIAQYGSEEGEGQQELIMQKQRIGGIIDQITMIGIFLERGQVLLQSVANEARREEVIQLICDAMKKKKKQELIAEFMRKIGRG